MDRTRGRGWGGWGNGDGGSYDRFRLAAPWQNRNRFWGRRDPMTGDPRGGGAVRRDAYNTQMGSWMGARPTGEGATGDSYATWMRSMPAIRAFQGRGLGPNFADQGPAESLIGQPRFGGAMPNPLPNDRLTNMIRRRYAHGVLPGD